jgi:SAM-dependent methyltransferase
MSIVKFYQSYLNRSICTLKRFFKLRLKIIFDLNISLPREKIINRTINYKFYSKDILCRNFILGKKSFKKLNFLDLGGKDRALPYLLRYHKNFENNLNYLSDKNKFFRIYNYFCTDINLNRKNDNNFFEDNICNENYLKKRPKFINHFDIIYSNNVFEHLKKPWIACSNINKMLKNKGECITVVPFSQRYHEFPVDCFRYTHQGIKYSFENEMQIKIIHQGYDIDGRRNNWN